MNDPWEVDQTDPWEAEDTSLKSRVIKAVDPIKRAGMPFLEGLSSGLTYGMVGAPESPKEPTISPPTPKLERTARRAGEFAGEGLAISGLGKLAGAGMAAIPATAEAMPLIVNSIRGALTGAAHEGIKGAIHGDDPMEILGKAGISAATFGMLEGPFASLVHSVASTLREAPEAMAQRFASPSSNSAVRHFNETGETFGKTLLDNADVTKGSARDVFQQAGGTLKRPNPGVNNAVSGIESKVQDEIARLNQRPTAEAVFGPQRPNIGPQRPGQGELPYNPPASTVETLPQNERVFQPRAQSPDLRDSGEVVRLGESPAQTTQPYGAKYDTLLNPMNPGTFEGVTYPSTGRFEPNPVDFQKRQFLAKQMEDAISEEIQRTSPSREEAMQRFRQEYLTKIGPHVDLEEAAAPVRQEIQRLRSIQGEGAAKAASMERVLDDFLANKPRYQPMGDTVNLRRDLDSITSKYYRGNALREATETPPEEEVNLLMSNALRGKIAEVSPKLAALFDRQHFLLRIQEALLPQMAGVGRKTVGAGMWTDLKNYLSSNLGTARTLESLSQGGDALASVGTPEFVGRGTEAALSDLVEKKAKGSGR